MNSQIPFCYLIKIHFNILPPYSHRPSEWTLPFLFSNQNSVQDYFHCHACHIPYSFCDCSLIPYYLTSTVNYETPQNASFSAQFLCLQFKHYSHHSALKHNQLINGKKHYQALKDLFDVIHSTHLLTICILTKNGLIKSNQTDQKPHFILHINHNILQHKGAIFTGINKGSYVQHVLQVPVKLPTIPNSNC